jgi:hypothetical protein
MVCAQISSREEQKFDKAALWTTNQLFKVLQILPKGSLVFLLQTDKKKQYFQKDSVLYHLIYILDVVEWSRALDVRLSEWCCSVSMVCAQISSREEQKFDSSKI